MEQLQRIQELRAQGHTLPECAEIMGIPGYLAAELSLTHTAPPEDTNTERAQEIAKCNYWNQKLNEVWEKVEDTDSLALQIDTLPKLINAFDKLSRSRRALGGLDKPAQTHITIEDKTPPDSIDSEVAALVSKLQMNDNQ